MLKNNADQLRKRLLATRKEIPAAQQQQQSRQICQFLDDWFNQQVLKARSTDATVSPIVAAFWPLKDEPDLTPFMTRIAGKGFRAALPVIVKRDAPLEFHQWVPGAPMISGVFGVKEPDSKLVLRPDVVLAPTLGYTERGDRMGYGGGYYDRTLAVLKASGPLMTIGVGWREGKIHLEHDNYQPEPHDIALDGVLNADGWVGGKGRVPPDMY